MISIFVGKYGVVLPILSKNTELYSRFYRKIRSCAPDFIGKYGVALPILSENTELYSIRNITMIERILQIEDVKEGSVFLFGARHTNPNLGVSHSLAFDDSYYSSSSSQCSSSTSSFIFSDFENTGFMPSHLKMCMKLPCEPYSVIRNSLPSSGKS